MNFIVRESSQIDLIKFGFFTEYFCFCYLKNSSCMLNRRWWREGGRGEHFFLNDGMRSEGVGVVKWSLNKNRV